MPMCSIARNDRTPSLDRQLLGPCCQDSVPWNPALQDNFACCTCTHMYTMWVEVNSDVNTANENARRRQDAAAVAAAFKSKSKRGGSNNVCAGINEELITTRAARHGCYCQSFNCFGSFNGVGCPSV